MQIRAEREKELRVGVRRDLGRGGTEIETMMEEVIFLLIRYTLALGRIIDTVDGPFHVRGRHLCHGRVTEVIRKGLVHGRPYRVHTRTTTNYLHITANPLHHTYIKVGIIGIETHTQTSFKVEVAVTCCQDYVHVERKGRMGSRRRSGYGTRLGNNTGRGTFDTCIESVRACQARVA